MTLAPKTLLDALQDLAEYAGEQTDPARLAQRTVERLRTILAVDATRLYWWSDEDGALLLLAAFDRRFPPDPEMQVLPGQGLIGRVFAERRPQIVDDYGCLPDGDPTRQAQGLQSAAAIPLLVGDRARGVLSIGVYAPQAFTPHDLQTLNLLGRQVASTIESFQLLQVADRRQAESEAFADLVRLAASGREPADIIDRVTQYACTLVSADYASVSLLEGDRVGRYGTRGNQTALWTDLRLPRGRGVGGQAIESGQTILLEDLNKNPTLNDQELPIARAEGAQSLLSVPLLSRDGPFGALILGWRTRTTIPPSRIQLAESLAHSAALALDASRLRDRTLHLRREAETLAEVGRALAASLSLNDTLAGITRAAAELLNADLTWVGLPMGNGFQCFSPYGAVSDTQAQFFVPRESAFSAAVLNTGASIVVHSVSELPPERITTPARRQLQAEGITSFTLTPILGRDQPVGTLFAGMRSPRAFSPAEVTLLERLGYLAGAAIENSRLHAESEERRRLLESVFQDAPVAVALLEGSDFRYRLANDKYRQIPGLRDREFVGRPVAEVVPEFVENGIVDLFRRAAAGEVITAHEAPLRLDAGRSYWTFTLLPHEIAGRPERAVLLVAIDVTQQVLARREAERLAIERAAILDQLPSGVLVTDSAGRITFANETVHRAFGGSLPAGDRHAIALAPIFAPRDPVTDEPTPLDQTPIAQALRGEDVRGITLKVRIPARSEDRQVLVSSVPLLGARGRIEGTVSTFTDLTERQRLRAEVARSEERLERVYQGVACAILVCDRTGTITQANQSAAEVIGIPIEHLIGQVALGATNILRDDGRPMPPEEIPLARVLATGQPVQHEVVGHVRADGSTTWYLSDAVPLPDRDGTVEEIILSFIDITELRAAQERLQIFAAGERLRTLGEMAGGVAHDLNQYLALIGGHADLALTQLGTAGDPDQVRQSLEMIVQTATDGGDVVKRLLAFGRPDADEAPERLSVEELLTDVVRLTAPRWRDAARRAGHAITVDVDAAPNLTINGQLNSLREAITNLIFNAVDALPHEGTIRLSARRTSDAVVISVADNGIGMPEEAQRRAFEPYFTTKGAQGTGLGLPVVHSVMERHGGRVEINSRPGEGTEFRLHFPMSDDAPLATPARPGARLTSEQINTGSRHLRILAVDDEQSLVQMVAQMLTADGHSVEVAFSGEEACNRLERESFDVVISDLGLGPGISGWEVADCVHALSPVTRFVLVTGWGVDVDVDSVQQHGVDVLLTKPYRLQQLRAALTG